MVSSSNFQKSVMFRTWKWPRPFRTLSRISSTAELNESTAHESTIMSRDKNGHLRLAGQPADYQKLGIDPVKVAQFEDGQRMGTEKGRYEWWYFDAHLDDGATIVVVFYTKPNVSPNGPLAPRITINLTLPDGQRFDKIYDTTADQFTASKAGCDVRIGCNRFVGDLHRYRITATIEEISVEIELTGEVRPWRPKSGHIYFGSEGREKLFAWLPSVPQGLASVRYKVGDQEYRASGSGYHDHNWGDVPMQTLMHNWYWARAKAGPYTVIASHITATTRHRSSTCWRRTPRLLRTMTPGLGDRARRNRWQDRQARRRHHPVYLSRWRCALYRDLRAAKDNFASHLHRASAVYEAPDRQDCWLRWCLSPLYGQSHDREI
jgi:hypothetical protein